jgi:phosphoribosyl-dephospho-CoA transferase
MTSLSRTVELRRHDLITISPSAWEKMLRTHDGLAAHPIAAQWAGGCLPLIARRPAPGDTAGIPAGLPLPPSAGKKRIPLVVQPEDIVAVQPPPLLGDVIGTAPQSWRPALRQIVDLGASHACEARVFGSLAWQFITGLVYLTETSDVDLLLSFSARSNVKALLGGLGNIEALAPMRLDGELIREDGAGVTWHEVRTSAEQILVKTLRDISLVEKHAYFQGAGAV